MEMPEVYLANAARFLELVVALDDTGLATRVPACPDWSVRDLLAHQSGSSTDLVQGVVGGVATPPWTGRQVADRRTRTVPELVSEWSGNLTGVAALCDSPSPNPGWDVTVHLSDLREALGLAPAPAEEEWGEVLAAARGFLEAQRGVLLSVAEHGPDPGTTAWHVATDHGLWRALFSRLDRAALEREVLRGDVDAFARTAFFAS